MKEGTNEKGMFPANFTKPLWELSSVRHHTPMLIRDSVFYFKVVEESRN